MIKTTVTADKNDLLISIPDDYIGKKLEILLYSLEELKYDRKKKSIRKFQGALSDHDYAELRIHSEKARKEWSRDI